MDPITPSVEYGPPVVVDLVEADASSPSTVIIETVMALSDKGVTELDSLAETVDPDALDSLFEYDAGAFGACSVELVIDEFLVTVRDDGLVRFEEYAE